MQSPSLKRYVAFPLNPDTRQVDIKSRCDELHTLRRREYKDARRRIEAREEKPGSIASPDCAARAKFLASAVHSTGTKTATFAEYAEKSATVIDSNRSTEAASLAVAKSHDAVTAVLSSAGARRESTAGAGSSDGGAAQVLKMARESFATGISACNEAVKEWWSRQVATAEEGLELREMALQDQRCASHATVDMDLEQTYGRHTGNSFCAPKGAAV